MEAFSLCVLQKHNCMCKSAEIPALPDPAPIATFRGSPVTPEVAEDLFIGWLGKEQFSWKVVSDRCVLRFAVRCAVRCAGIEGAWYVRIRRRVPLVKLTTFQNICLLGDYRDFEL